LDSRTPARLAGAGRPGETSFKKVNKFRDVEGASQQADEPGAPFSTDELISRASGQETRAVGDEGYRAALRPARSLTNAYSCELNWHFERHPLIRQSGAGTVLAIVRLWLDSAGARMVSSSGNRRGRSGPWVGRAGGRRELFLGGRKAQQNSRIIGRTLCVRRRLKCGRTPLFAFWAMEAPSLPLGGGRSSRGVIGFD